ncbi:MAG: hypothetical protein PVJ39_02845 [Gammaproteobacteria bacterium]|jgi:hypothetical protein
MKAMVFRTSKRYFPAHYFQRDAVSVNQAAILLGNMQILEDVKGITVLDDTKLETLSWLLGWSSLMNPAKTVWRQMC